MHTYIKKISQTPADRLLMGVASFAVGSFIGFIAAAPPSIPYSCPSMHYGAHFLERGIAFKASKLRPSSSSVTSLRAAAPEKAPVIPARRAVAILDTSSASPVSPESSTPSSAASVMSDDASSSPLPLRASSVSSAESAPAQRSSTAYVRTILHSLRYLMTSRGLTRLEAKQVILALRAQFVKMIDNDLQFVHPDDNGQRVCR